jgi:hypothetical protein
MYSPLRDIFCTLRAALASATEPEYTVFRNPQALKHSSHSLRRSYILAELCCELPSACSSTFTIHLLPIVTPELSQYFLNRSFLIPSVELEGLSVLNFFIARL